MCCAQCARTRLFNINTHNVIRVNSDCKVCACMRPLSVLTADDIPAVMRSIRKSEHTSSVGTGITHVVLLLRETCVRA